MCVTLENHVGAVVQDRCTLWAIGYPIHFLFLDIFLFMFRALAIVAFTRNPEENLLNGIIFHIRLYNEPKNCKFKRRISEKNTWVQSVLQQNLGTSWTSEESRFDSRQEQEIYLICRRL
jgi:hypothetical protein